MNHIADTSFHCRLLAWFEQHGRHDLPWQYHQLPQADIYAVWLSEIMLQQTQVATVLNFFPRFLAAFPTVQALAAADWEAVAPLWAGLGYYARARNLHAGAKQLSDYIATYGHFPQTVDEWCAIKGVGRSTAGAIVAMGVRGFGVICDGNVKRVLTRHRAITGDITKAATDHQLWQIATELTPSKNSGRYAQAMMDLGATICTRTKPKCHLCPIAADCQAFQTGTQSQFPVKKKPPAKPHRHTLALQLVHHQQTLWLHRTTDGIWSGLHSLPLHTLSASDDKALSHTHIAQILTKNLDNYQTDNAQDWQIASLLDTLQLLHAAPTKHIRHTLTHFHWHLYLLTVQLNDQQFTQINTLLNALHSDYQWRSNTKQLALPAAMVKLLATD